MDKSKSNRLLYAALILGSIVYLVKDIVVHEYKYWQCLNSYQVAHNRYLDLNYAKAMHVETCVKIINKS